MSYCLSAFSFNIGLSFWICSKCSICSISEVKCRKNFIRENVRQLREMQGYRRNEEEYDTVTGRRPTANRYENVPARTPYRCVSSGVANI